MPRPTNDKIHMNAALAGVLRRKHPSWQATAEQRDVLEGAREEKPDILVTQAGPGRTVVLETEFYPFYGVEGDARARLGHVLRETGQMIEQVIAVKLPKELKTIPQHLLELRIESETFEMCILSGTGPTEVVRWPKRGWIGCSVDELARYIGIVSLSARLVTAGVRILERGITHASGVLTKELPPRVIETFGELLHQAPGEQTTRMAAAIMADAAIFQERLSKIHKRVPSLREIREKHGFMSQRATLECWQNILDINYWPIFSISKKLLVSIPASTAPTMLERIEQVVDELSQLGAIDIQDLSGRMFQALIADRKFLATFYTLPASAALLAEMAVSRLNVDWSDAGQVTGLRIADFACGTGALMGAAYNAVATRYRCTGQDDGELHASMMENALLAADIMPAATHLTATTLSSMHPARTYDRTSVMTMPYGKMPDRDGLAIGSLDLLEDTPATRLLFGNGQEMLRGTGEAVPNTEEERVDRIDLPHESMDLVIMNPPFTRPTNHALTSIPVPSFAGFGTSKKEQAAMADRLRHLTRGLPVSVGHGNAGLASNFVDLAHAKVRRGGVLAMVLPAVCASGASWRKFRQLLRDHYTDVVFVAIASQGSTDRAFSADTGMAEVLVLGTRLKFGESPGDRIAIVNLHARPQSLLEGVVTAETIAGMSADRGRLHVTGGFMVRVGADRLGKPGGLGPIGIVRESLVQAMLSLERGMLEMPRKVHPVPLPVVMLNELGRRGAVDRDINGKRDRGPFDIEPADPGKMNRPALWNHAADRERRFVVQPDSQGVARPGCKERARVLWDRIASRLHINLKFRLNSQSLAACLTPDRALGGSAWPNYILHDTAWEIPVVLWANTTLGLMSFWWAGSRQQQGRALWTISRLPELLTIDPRSFDESRMESCNAVFAGLKDREFLPANEAYRDPARQDLDRAMLIDVLGLDESVLPEIDLLRSQWCGEPSVHGGKRTRPY